MTILSSAQFAAAVGISERVARKRIAKGTYMGHRLATFTVSGNKGGSAGKVLFVDLEACAPELRALLTPAETLPSTPVSTAVSHPVRPRLERRPDERHFESVAEKQRIVAPILETSRGSRERAEAYRRVAATVHRFGDGVRTFSERTLRDWVRAQENGGPAALLPAARSDRGRFRVLVSQTWDGQSGLPDDVRERIAAQLEATARGLIVKKRSERDVVRLCQTELMRLTRAAGADIPLAQLRGVCKISTRWVRRFAEMKPVALFKGDHKRYSDQHEFRVSRELTRTPMEVLYGDVHIVDLSVAQARQSPDPELRRSGKQAAKQGLVSIRIAIIGWLDGSSHYLWATVVILGPGQGITQQDVARSLFEVVSCPHGGIPRQIAIDNGTEYAALSEAINRLSTLSEMAGFGVVTSIPYAPEGKGRLEGTFNIWEKRHVSALPGYIAGERMKSPTKSKGRALDPYPHGPERLIEDLDLCTAQFNGTPQDGQLGGLSPKAMLEAKIAVTGWRAQVPDADTFDLVFSREERRDVVKGSVSIKGRLYFGAVLAEMIGEKQAPFLVPLRDPEGSVLHIRRNKVSGRDEIHRLECETFALNDPAGARRKGEMVKLQRAEITKRSKTADMAVDPQAMLSAAADLDPVAANEPDRWSMPALDKAGVITGAPREATGEAREHKPRSAAITPEMIENFDRNNGTDWSRYG